MKALTAAWSLTSSPRNGNNGAILSRWGNPTFLVTSCQQPFNQRHELSAGLGGIGHNANILADLSPFFIGQTEKPEHPVTDKGDVTVVILRLHHQCLEFADGLDSQEVTAKRPLTSRL